MTAALALSVLFTERPKVGLALLAGAALITVSVAAPKFAVIRVLPALALVPPLIRLPIADSRGVYWLAMLALSIGPLLSPRTTRKLPGAVKLAAGTFFLFVLLVYLIHPHVPGSTSRLLDLTVETAVPIVATAWAVTDENEAWKVASTVTFVVSVSALLGVVEFVLHRHLLPADNLTYFFNAPDRGGQIRTQGLFPHPLVQGAAITLALPLALAMATRRHGRHRLMFLVETAVMVAGSLMTFGRGAWIAAGIAVLLFATLTRGLARISVLGFATAFVFCLPALPIGGTVTDLVTSVGQSGGTGGYTVQYREELYRAATDYARQHPFGAGLNAEGTLNLPGIVGGNVSNLAVSVDNAYAKYALEIGPVGLALFLAFLATALAATASAAGRLRQRPGGSLANAVLAAQIGMLVQSATVATFTWEQLGLLFWILCGVGFALARQDARPTAASEHFRG